MTENITTLYEKGLSTYEISKIVEIPRETLRVKLKKMGVKLRKSRKEMGIKYHKPLIRMNEGAAELLGLHAGDGSLSLNEWSISTNINDKKLINRIIFLVRKMVGIEPRVGYRLSFNKVDIRSGQHQTLNYFARYFPSGKKSYIVELPKEIMNSDKLYVIKGVLRGLISSDGCFYFRKRWLSPRLEFRVKSEKLRDQFIELSNRLNFKFNKSNPKDKNGIIYTAYIERINTVLRWMKEIGSGSEIHMKRFDLWMQLKFSGGT